MANETEKIRDVFEEWNNVFSADEEISEFKVLETWMADKQVYVS